MEVQEKILKSKSFNKINAFMKNEKLSHAYFIICESDFSLKQFVKAFSMKLVCSSHTNCGVCSGCRKIENDFHPDVLVYPKGKNFMVADSENIIENVQVKPLESTYKVIVINRIDNSTVQAQNKILKTIEEAPNNVIFLITAINSNAVLPTIKSRTQVLEIENFEDVSEEHKQIEDFCFEMLENMNSTKKITEYVGRFSEKTNFKNRLIILGETFEKLLYAKTTESEHSKLAEQFEVGAIGEIFSLITTALRQFEANVNTNIITDILLFKILEVKYLWSKNK